MIKQLYSITGVLFQQRRGFDLELDSVSDSSELIMKISSVMNFAMFFGIVGPSPDSESLSGHMTDRFGESVITDFAIGAETLTFTKTYGGRPSIFYEFKNEVISEEVVGLPDLNLSNDQEVWFGKYSGPDCGSGKFKCIITPIKESFFIP